jgi:acetyl-CoA carboxylase carboxyltransferase component
MVPILPARPGGRSAAPHPPSDAPAARTTALRDIVPKDKRFGYDMRAILNSVVDQGSLFEMGRPFGASVITAFARLDGWPVAVLASNPNVYGGGWTAEAAQKVTRFVDLAETFRLPVVHFVDIPGFVIGTRAERAGTIRHGAKALSAIYQASVPWCTMLIRKAYGVAGAAMMDHTRFRYRYAWPSGDWGSLPLEGGVEAAFKSALAASDDPEAMKAELAAACATCPIRSRPPSASGSRRYRSRRDAAAADRVRQSDREAAHARQAGNALSAIDRLTIAYTNYRLDRDRQGRRRMGSTQRSPP